MPYISIKSHLDGSILPLYAATSDVLGVEALVNKTGANATISFSCWVEKESGERYSLQKDILLSTQPLKIPFKGKALVGGDTLVVQAYSPDPELAADITLTLFGDGGSENLTISHLLATTTFSTDIGCGGCVTGGKVLDLTEFVAGETYRIGVEKSPTFSGTLDDLQYIEVHYWSVTPYCPPSGGAAWTGRNFYSTFFLDAGLGEFTFTFPGGTFEGISLFGYNTALTGVHRYDCICCSWDKTTRTLTLNGFQ